MRRNPYQPIGETSVVVRDLIRGYGVETIRDEVYGPEARFAMELITRWGMVAASPDGEDSAGRQKLRLLSPEELVDRALQVAEEFTQACRDRRLTHHVVVEPDEEKEQ